LLLSDHDTMIYDIRSAQYYGFLSSGKVTPTTDEVCDALGEIKKSHPHLDAVQMASQLQIMHPQWLMDNLNWVELQERLDDDE